MNSGCNQPVAESGASSFQMMDHLKIKSTGDDISSTILATLVFTISSTFYDESKESKTQDHAPPFDIGNKEN